MTDASASLDGATLEVEQPDRTPQSIPLGGIALKDGILRVGRSQDSDLQILDGRVSKKHLEIHERSGRLFAVDVGSKAGVLVNGMPIQEHRLVDGDEIALGPSCPVRIRFASTRDADARTATRGTGTALLSSLPDNVGQGGMERLAKFFEFSRMLGGHFDLTDVLDSVVDLAIEITGAERGMVVLCRPQDRLEIRVARGPNGTSLPLVGLRLSETIVRQSIAHGAPRIVSDISEDLDLAQAQSVLSLELRSAVTLPLSRFRSNDAQDQRVEATDEVFGVLYLDSRQRRATFGRFDMGILETLARDASSVIENARLLREAEQKRQIEQELKTAREVQAALMPDEFVGAAHFEVVGTCVPCHDLGGDYIDQFDMPNGRCAFVVADVCGKGIAASLLAAALQGALAAEIVENRPLGDLVEHVNRVLCRLAPIGKFISMILAVLDPDGTVRFVNAGHCPLHFVHPDGIEQLVTKGLALGLEESVPYREAQLRMQPGDAIVLYSDGVLECEDPEKALFGEERVDAALDGLRGRPAREMLDGLISAVDTFRRNAPVSDDLSLLVIRYVGAAD